MMKVRMYTDLFQGIDLGTLTATARPYNAPIGVRVAFTLDIPDHIIDKVNRATDSAPMATEVKVERGSDEQTKDREAG